MIGIFYGIEIGCTAPEIENAIDVVNYGAVRHLVDNPDFDRVIEARLINHAKAHPLEDKVRDYLLENFTHID